MHSFQFVKSYCYTHFCVYRVLILDEIDHLTSKPFGTLIRELVETATQSSKLILVGIANSLDLTVRSAGAPSALPLEDPVKKSDCAHLYYLHFPPYTHEDMEVILSQRLAGEAAGVMTPMGIKFLAMRCAQHTGDLRSALLAAREGLAEAEWKKSSSHTGNFPLPFPGQLKAVSKEYICNVYLAEGSKENEMLVPCKPEDPEGRPTVGVLTMSKILGSQKSKSAPPLHHALIMCTLDLMNRVDPQSATLRDKGVPVRLLFDKYRQFCVDKGIAPQDRSEVLSMVQVLVGGENLSLSQQAGSFHSHKRKKCKIIGLVNSTTAESHIFYDPQVVKDFVRNANLPFTY